MKAVILAAGKGERLSEITRKIPKPMIEFKGKPLLQHNIELCKKYGISDIFINLHHLPDRITDFFGNGERLNVNIKYSYEKELLGTAGAVKRIAGEFWKLGSLDVRKMGRFENRKDVKSFFVIYGDNYSNYDLQLLIDKQKETDSCCIIGFHYREDVSHSGVAEFDRNNKILRFIEKPKEGESKSHWVNAGIYLLKNSMLAYIKEGTSDFGKDVFPQILRDNVPMYGVYKDADVKAFDTPEMYKKHFSN